MKRVLLTQMSNEWRNNIWLILGLTIVSLAIWFFGAALFTIMQHFFRPLGFDGKDVFVLEIGRYSPNSPNYVDGGDNTWEMNNNDMKHIIAQLRNNPNVEAAGFTRNCTPYQNSYAINYVRLRYPEADTIVYYGNTGYISPEIVKVLKLQSRSGKDTDYLQQKLEAGEMLIGHVDKERLPDDRIDNYRLAEDLAGQYICGWDTTKVYRLADVINKVRRNAYWDEPTWGTILYPIDETGDVTESWNIMLRVKPGCADKFRRDFEENPSMTAQRNIYVRKCEKLSDMQKSNERRNDMQVRMYSVIIGFMLLIIFLGLLGTFWFRMQQRVSEIAIRRVCGARYGDIFRRMISEGLILLVGATLLAAAVGWFAIVKLGYDERYTRIELLWLEVATFVVVALGIILSIFTPAWLAMRINPAEAVKED